MAELNASKTLVTSMRESSSLLPKDVQRCLSSALELKGRRDIVVLRYLARNSGDASEARRWILSAFCGADERGGCLAGGDVVGDGGDGADADGGVIACVVYEVTEGFDVRLDTAVANCDDGRTDARDRDCLESEGGDNAKVVGTALECPEEVGVGGRRGSDERPVAEDDFVAGDLVHAETVLVDQVIDTAEEGDAGDANGAQTTSNYIEAFGFEELVYFDPPVACTDRDSCFILSEGEGLQSVQR